MFKLTKSEQLLKSFNFFEFSGFYKDIVTFSGLFFVIDSVLSVLFSFTPKSPEKADNECCLIGNPKKMFQPRLLNSVQ